MACETASFSALGTTAAVTVVDGQALPEALALVQDELRRIDETCSRFRDDSELAFLNRSAGRPFVASPLLLEALTVALYAAARTDGDVDPTVGRSLGALGWDRDFSVVVARRRGAAPAHRARRRLEARAHRPRASHDLHSGACRDRSRRDGEGARGRSLRARRARARRGRVRSSTSAATSPWRAGPGGGWPIRVTDDHRSDATRRRADDRAGGRRPRHLEHDRAPLAQRRRRGAPHRRSAQRHARREVWRTVERGGRRLRAGQLGQHGGDRARGGRSGLARARGLPGTPRATRRHDRHHLRLARRGGGMNGVLTSGPVWYLMRGSGVVSLLLLTAVSALGMATVSRWRPGRVPRFVTLGLHRNLSLLAVVFLAHPRADGGDRSRRLGAPRLGLRAEPLRPLRALARARRARPRPRHRARRHEPATRAPARRLWRAVHWLAYLAWPVALLHGAGMGTDNAAAWMLAVDARVHRGLRRGRRAPAAERPARRRQAPGAEPGGCAVSALAAEPRDRARRRAAAAHARGRRPLAGGPPRALRPAAGVAPRGATRSRRGRGERTARARRSRLPDARQAARGRCQALAHRGRERRRGRAREPQGRSADARQSAPRARRRGVAAASASALAASSSRVGRRRTGGTCGRLGCHR